ncbi:unnamed protein product [Chrysoparadoxa australica]
MLPTSLRSCKLRCAVASLSCSRRLTLQAAPLLAKLPKPWAGDPAPLIKSLLAAKECAGKRLVVLDDDPTGTQTVHSVPVLAGWSVAELAQELRHVSEFPVMYLLTNARALPAAEASQLFKVISANLRAASKETGVDVTIVSRSDSTLRAGHYPLDLEAIEDGQPEEARAHGWVVMPFFEAGGRITIDDVHYVRKDEELVPAADTEFARDAAFGFKSSNLRSWVEEKSTGVMPASEVISISLQDIRVGGPEAVASKLHQLEGGAVAVVNAVVDSDLQVFTAGSLLAESRGRRLLYRTAASFVASRGGVTPKPLLEADDLSPLRKTNTGGLVVVGSYVPTSSGQLKSALNGTLSTLVGVELCVDDLVGADASPAKVVAGVVEQLNKVEEVLGKGECAVLHTSRTLRQDDGQGGLSIGGVVSEALVEVVRSLAVAPKFIIAKGGITSNDIATDALGITRANVLGQILPGVPVWSCESNSLWPGLTYVVFPGNVGGPESLKEAMLKLGVAQRLTGERHGVGAKGQDGAEQAGQSLTLRILQTAEAQGGAIGAFNVYNMEGVKAVLAAAEAAQSPAILQVHPVVLEYGGVPLLKYMRAAAREASVPIAVALDHAVDEDAIWLALESGCLDSVMVDGSAMDYERNIEWTAAIAELAHEKGVAVEAELGRLAGEEDGLRIEEVEARMTDPDQVADFVARTKVDSIAVTIGNVHGKYAKPPNLDFDRLRRIRESCPEHIPLVLHGASGLPPAMVREAISLGVRKLNVNTELRAEYISSVREAIEGNCDVLDTMKLSSGAMQAKVLEKIELFK